MFDFIVLQQVSMHCEDLAFLKPLFILGHANKPTYWKDAEFISIKHKEVMKQFRKRECNLLIATSVLEEGVDVPICNLIVRFDTIKTYCDYVQTKGNDKSDTVSHSDSAECSSPTIFMGYEK